MHHHHWIQKLGIVLALLVIVLDFFAMVQQWRAPKMRPHDVQQIQAHITMPTGSIPNPHNRYTGVVLATVLANKKFQLAMYQLSVYFVTV